MCIRDRYKKYIIRLQYNNQKQQCLVSIRRSNNSSVGSTSVFLMTLFGVVVADRSFLTGAITPVIGCGNLSPISKATCLDIAQD